MREAYNKAVTAYRKAFEKKHGLEFDEWVCDEVGTVGCFNCGMFYIDFNDLKTDIDLGAPKGKFIEWYDFTLDAYYKNEPLINYKTFLKLIK